MDISELQQNGGLVSDELVKRSATWNDQEIEFYCRKLAFGDVDRAMNNADGSQSADLIRLGVRLGDNGDQALTYEQAYQLDAGLASTFADAIMEVNGIDEADADPKGSARKSSSGSKSGKASAPPSAKPDSE